MPLDNYLWEKSAKRRHTALTINSKGELIVKTPLFTRRATVEAMIREKMDWIIKHQRRQSHRIHPQLPDFSPKGELYLYGQKCTFICLEQSPAQVIEAEGSITIYAKSEALFKRALTQWYTSKSEVVVKRYLQLYEQKIHRMPTQISYKRVKSKWGSCDSNNRIMFNSLLSQHSKEHIEYIVVHELAHIKEKHHKAAFWNHGEKLLPGFKALHKEMLQ